MEREKSGLTFWNNVVARCKFVYSCQERRESFLCSVNDCLQYSDSFAILMLLLVLLPSRLQSPQSCGFFERIIAFNFMISRSCIRFFNSEVIHGDLFKRTRFVRKGAWVLTTFKNLIFHSSQTSQFWVAMSLRKWLRLKFLWWITSSKWGGQIFFGTS